MAKQITTSANIYLLDSEVDANICLGLFKVNLSPSIFSVGGALNILGGFLQIKNPFGVVIKDYTTSGYDFSPTGSPPLMNTVEVAIPTEAGNYQYGTYTVTVKIVDADATEYTDEKSVTICLPDPNNKTKKFGCINATITGNCKDGKVVVQVDSPPTYRGELSDSVDQSFTLEYPTSSGISPLTTSHSSFSDVLFEGIYKITGEVCATYNFDDHVSVSVKYKVKCQKEIKCIIDECCIQANIAALHDQLYNTDCSEAEKEETFSKICEAVGLLKAIELAANCGADPSDYITQLEKLLGCTCTCNCNEGTPIINNSPNKDFLIEGCGFTKETVGLTDIYTLNNRSYTVTVNENGGVLTVGDPIVDGCNVTIPLNFDASSILPTDSCQWYLNPETGIHWSTAETADAAIDDDCKTEGFTILSLDAIGDPQEYWYQYVNGTLTLVLKLPYKTIGENSVRTGSLYNAAAFKNSFVAGQSAYVGALYDVSTISIGSTSTTIVASSGSFTQGDKVAIVQLGGGVVEWRGEAFAGSTGTTLVIPIVLNNSTAANFKIVKLNINGAKASAISIGRNVVACDDTAIAIGESCFALKPNSMALGLGSIANGIAAIALNGANVTGDYSFSFGAGTIAGDYAFFAGLYHSILADYSFGFGRNLKNTADAVDSFMIGNGALADKRGQFIHAMRKFSETGFDNGSAQFEIINLGVRVSSATTRSFTLDKDKAATGAVTDATYDGADYLIGSSIFSFKGEIHVQKEITSGSPSTVASIYYVKGKYVRGVGLVLLTLKQDYNGLSLGTTKTFNAATAPNTTTDAILITSHGFSANDPVYYANAGVGTSIKGLSNKKTYYINVVDANNVTLSEIIGGDVIDLTAVGSGTQSLTKLPISVSISTVSGSDYLNMTLTSATTDALRSWVSLKIQNSTFLAHT